MKKLNITLVLGFLACMFIHTAWAQPSATIAEKQFESGDYERALLNYIDLLQDRPDDPLAKKRIAACYAYMNNPQQAVEFYQDLSLKGDLSPQDQLLMAMSLKKLGEYKSAKKWFERYASFDQKTGTHYANSCTEAHSLRMKNEQFLIFPLNNMEKQNEFGPCVGPNGLIFNKMTTSDLPTVCNYGIYTAEGEEAYFQDAQLVQWRVGNHMDKVFIDYSPSGDKVLFTKLSDKTCFNGLTAKGGMAIYEAEVQADGSWTNERALPYNSIGSGTAYAAYGNSDDELFFSSDHPNGFGGYDIYWAIRDINGQWTKARNLGPDVNSEGDEIAPQWNGVDLIFASNWHAGLGGFDLFASAFNDKKFETPQNLGRPINSSMDDWNLIFVDQESGYFCTNRNIDQSGSDIFYFTELKEQAVAKAIFTSQETEKEVTDEEAKVELEIAEEYVVALPLNFEGNISQFDNNYPQNVKRVYSVQVAVLDKNNNDFSKFNTQLGDIDAIYKIYYDQVVKIRVGSYENEVKAEQTLQRIKNRGYKDAFIVEEKMIIAHNEEKESAATSVKSYESGKYKVRLATYKHPEYFQRNKVKDFGKIVEIKKDPYTIFLLGHYDDLLEARKILDKVKKVGFQNAEIVVQDQDVIRRIE